MATHELKTHPQHFAHVSDGTKRVEVRKDDRPFAVGDRLTLREWDPVTGEYTGRFVEVRITHVLRGFEGLASDWVALSIEPLQRSLFEVVS